MIDITALASALFALFVAVFLGRSYVKDMEAYRGMVILLDRRLTKLEKEKEKDND